MTRIELEWPHEGAAPRPPASAHFTHAGSNICLDIHGDPVQAQAIVFSDGNHHMALAEALALFRARNPAVEDVFYVTTPPRIVVDALKSGALAIGNLVLTRMPHIFVSPHAVLRRLEAEGLVATPAPLARGRGSVLLVRAGNPKAIHGAADLARHDVRLFLSNPRTEAVSYQIYTSTLRNLAAQHGLDFSFIDAPGAVVHGELIHHREAPQYVADGRADAAVVFLHLALRYTRVFPGVFETIALAPADSPVHTATDVSAALVGDGGPWGERLLAHLLGADVAGIYRHHGLVPALN